MRKFLYLIVLLLIISNLAAQDAINVLFLGNSYTAVNNLPQLCAMLAESADKTMHVESVTPGGCLLTQHAVNSESLNHIRKGCWDYVVIQEQSQLPTIDFYRREFMYSGYQNLRDSVMFYNPDAQIVGYITWGRRYGGQQCEDYGLGLYCSADFRDFSHMQDSLSSAYNECIELFGGITAPVGEAWRNAITQSDIILHSSDNSHPSIEGSYLAACVFHATLWNESPIGLKHPEEISGRNAYFLQKTAAETVLQTYSNIENNSNDSYCISTSEREITIFSEKNINATVSMFDISGNELAKTEINNAYSHRISNDNIHKGIAIIKITDKNTSVTSTYKIAIQ